MVDPSEMSPYAAPVSALADDVAVFRSFTRMYTRYLGTLNEGLFNTKYSLPEGRVLYELATRVAPQANAIAQALGMDPGYLSRLLRKFERAGLLKRKASAHDGRSAELLLTSRGKSEFKNPHSLSRPPPRPNPKNSSPRRSRAPDRLHAGHRRHPGYAGARPAHLCAAPASRGRHGLDRASRGPGLRRAIRLGRHIRSSGRAHRRRFRHQIRSGSRALLDRGSRRPERGSHLFGPTSRRAAHRETPASLCGAFRAWARPRRRPGQRMHPLRALRRLPQNHAVDPKHAHRRPSHLQKSQLPPGERRAASQLWKGSNRSGVGFGLEIKAFASPAENPS